MLNLDPDNLHGGKVEQALLDYCLLGHTRTLHMLTTKYQLMRGRKKPPTRRFNTLRAWSKTYNWAPHVQEWDAEQRRKQIETAAHEEEEVASARLAARLAVVDALRAKGLEALDLIAPKTLARHPNAVIRMLDSASDQERKDTHPEGPPTSTTNVTVHNTEEHKVIFVLPPNGRDELSAHSAPLLLNP